MDQLLLENYSKIKTHYVWDADYQHLFYLFSNIKNIYLSYEYLKIMQ